MPPMYPPLVNGMAPTPLTFNIDATGEGAAEARAQLTFDPVKGTLGYDITVAGVEAVDLFAVALRYENEDSLWTVVQNISGPEVTETVSTLTLSPTNRARLEAGELYLDVFTREHPFGAARARLELPR